MTTNLLSVIEQQHKALKLAVTQNSHDMVMTGEELRQCEAALAAGQQALEQVQGEGVPQAWTNLLAYVLQDDMHNRLTPRVSDIAYTAFTLAKQPNKEDGGASDWFNDTKPKVTELIAKLRKDLVEELAPAEPQALEQTQVEALHVGDSSFEDWYQSYPRQGISKQVARDAYAAGMGDPLVATHPQATEPAPTGCDYCTSPLYAGTKCKSCGRVNEPAHRTNHDSHP